MLDRYIFGRNRNGKSRAERAAREVIDDVIDGKDNLTVPIKTLPILGESLFKTAVRVEIIQASKKDTKPPIQSAMDIYTGIIAEGKAKYPKHSSKT